MIRLTGISKTIIDEKYGSRVLFRNLNAQVPTNRRVAILSGDMRLATCLLHFVAGSDVPSSGQILRGKCRCSPIVHRGASLLPQLSGVENIAFYARVHGVETRRLVAAVDSSCGLGHRLNKPLRLLEVGLRAEMEAAMVAALRYDCYLIDQLQELPQQLQSRFFHTARVHKSGVIFSTRQLDLAARFGEVFVVIRDNAAQVFDRLSQAMGYHEREY
jgi:capsular polysaccharide transport system ATP-binding protein